MADSINILIPDGESTWAINVIQCLRDQSHLKLHIVSAKPRTAVTFSKYISSYRYYEQSSDWLNTVNDVIEKKQIQLIVPIAEKSCQFLISNRENIDGSAKIMMLPTFDSYTTAIDKRKLYHFLINENLPTPQSLFIEPHSKNSINLDCFKFPVLLKPLDQKGGIGIQRFGNRKDLESFIASNNEQGLFIQQYISGYDIDCSVLCEDGNIIAHTIQKGFLGAKNPYAPQLGFEFLKNDAVYQVTSNVMKALNWNGIAHLDLRHDAEADDYKLLEINARFWGSTEASKSVGVNFPLQIIRKSLGLSLTQTTYRNEQFMRYKGLFIQPSKLFNWSFVKNNTDVFSVLKDPIPTLYRFKEWLFRKI